MLRWPEALIDDGGGIRATNAAQDPVDCPCRLYLRMKISRQQRHPCHGTRENVNDFVYQRSGGWLPVRMLKDRDQELDRKSRCDQRDSRTCYCALLVQSTIFGRLETNTLRFHLFAMSQHVDLRLLEPQRHCKSSSPDGDRVKPLAVSPAVFPSSDPVPRPAAVRVA